MVSLKDPPSTLTRQANSWGLNILPVWWVLMLWSFQLAWHYISVWHTHALHSISTLLGIQSILHCHHFLSTCCSQKLASALFYCEIIFRVQNGFLLSIWTESSFGLKNPSKRHSLGKYHNFSDKISIVWKSTGVNVTWFVVSTDQMR